ncbi:hypothetical protein NB037_03235 [Rathayibacter sp. ZW T2_19]|uniref:Uncharacterized protein n=1 Tax=Rathayibacter rubneri TaxID=2950106 RepID=A0A9X2DVB8_9MICO|nr:hypothetical protein [Rathayibacter rubneri]MCM6761422.1 hypothetical protein [Rathayibacter rubneri]
MKRLHYAGGALLVGDAVAHEILAYARELGLRGIADTVRVAGTSLEGEREQAELLIGPASQLLLVEDDAPEDPDADAATLADLAERTRALTPRVEHVAAEEQSDAVDEYDEWALLSRDQD